MANDTSPHAERVLRARMAALTPAERVAEGHIRAMTQNASENALARLLWGDDLYRRVHPDRELPEP